MTVERSVARQIAQRLLDGESAAERVRILQPRLPEDEPIGDRMPASRDRTVAGLNRRREFLRGLGHTIDALAEGDDQAAAEATIENAIGFLRLPVGVIGPLRINGSAAQGDFHVPMATTEGALLASCNRGAFVISHAGGAATLCLAEVVSRAPCFSFHSLVEAVQFVDWATSRFEELKAIAGETTRHGSLTGLRTALIGKEVYLIFDYQTGDAAGQNMVTFATDHVCHYLVEHSPVRPEHWYVEGNLSGDKKATMQSFLYARGRKVVAEVRVPGDLLHRVLHVAAADMTRYWEISVLGGTQSGSIGVQGHYANALAAIFAACGQDIACVSEASVGLTRMEAGEDGSLYASVVLPNLIVGTVGGGTGLATTAECLDMIGCRGTGGARKLAEICAATVLAGELSIIAAMAANEFAAAHRNYGRTTPRSPSP